MPALFHTPKVQQLESSPEIAPPELKSETAKNEADAKRQKLKDARRVQTILSGGAVDETQKAIDGQSWQATA